MVESFPLRAVMVEDMLRWIDYGVVQPLWEDMVGVTVTDISRQAETWLPDPGQSFSLFWMRRTGK